MNYFLALFFICPMLQGMDAHKMAAVQNTSAQDSLKEFTILTSELNRELLAYVEPERIEKHLDSWTELKSSQATMPYRMIQHIMVTARTAQELAQATAQEQAKVSGTKLQIATQNYINAQLNYSAICDYLGIKPH